jgi:hypothetical protein
MKKKIPAASLKMILCRNGDVLWEPRQVPLIKESLGISQRAELARRAMAEPINRSPRLSPASLADFDDLAAMPVYAKLIYVISALLVMAGIGVLIWAFI